MANAAKLPEPRAACKRRVDHGANTMRNITSPHITRLTWQHESHYNYVYVYHRLRASLPHWSTDYGLAVRDAATENWQVQMLGSRIRAWQQTSPQLCNCGLDLRLPVPGQSTALHTLSLACCLRCLVGAVARAITEPHCTRVALLSLGTSSAQLHVSTKGAWTTAASRPETSPCRTCSCGQRARLEHHPAQAGNASRARVSRGPPSVLCSTWSYVWPC